MTLLEITNTALAEYSLGQIVSIDSPQHQFDKDVSLIVKKNSLAFLEEYNWRFAMVTKILSDPIKTPETSDLQLYEFRLPKDVARLYLVEARVKYSDLPTLTFTYTSVTPIPDLSQLEIYDTDKDILYATSPEVRIRYVSNNYLQHTYSGLASKILVLDIKKSLTFGTTGAGIRTEESYRTERNQLVRTAKAVGSIQKRLPKVQTNFWYNARFTPQLTNNIRGR